MSGYFLNSLIVTVIGVVTVIVVRLSPATPWLYSASASDA